MRRKYMPVANPLLWSDSWCQHGVAEQQWKTVRRELAAWPETTHVAFDAYRMLIERARPSTVLELGCGVGHYADVTRIIDERIEYVGCDVSESAIAIARKRFSHSQFLLSAAEDVRSSRLFDVVVLGAIIGHVDKWEELIAGAWKLSSRYLLLHRVGVYQHGEPTTESVKPAYGVKMAERFFREDALLNAVGGMMSCDPVRWPHADMGCMVSYLVEK